MQQLSDRQAGAILEDFIATLKISLGYNLVGVYLYGSLATSDFVENQSDIDLLIVLNDDVSQQTLDSLIELHKQFYTNHTSWQKRIDVAYVSKSALWNFQNKTYKCIVSDDDKLLAIVDAPQYYLIDWFKVQEHGKVLCGPEISEIMPSIPVKAFKQTIYDYMLTFSKSVTDFKKCGEQAYAVLTMCRSLYAYKSGEHASKKAGALWAMAHYPQWYNLIQKALEWNRNEKMNNNVDKENQRNTIEFVNFVLSKIKE